MNASFETNMLKMSFSAIKQHEILEVWLRTHSRQRTYIKATDFAGQFIILKRAFALSAMLNF